MCGPKFCPMHNFRDVDWDEVRELARAAKVAAPEVPYPG